MLVRLLPSQIPDHWEIIQESIEASVPPTAVLGDLGINRVLESLLTGVLQCWISYNEEEGVNGIVCTRLLEDDVSRTRNLLIYSVYAVGKTSRDDWVEGLGTLQRYALGLQCNQIVAYTEVDYIISIVKRLGGTAGTFLSIPVIKNLSKVADEDI